MSDESRRVSGTVHVASDSGSPERVAKELATTIAYSEKMSSIGYRKQFLDLYAECLHATKGYRQLT